MYEQVYHETPNHPDIAHILNNLGAAWQALGEARKAVSYYQRALAIYQQVYQETPNHPDIAGTLKNLGKAWRALGDGRQAVSYYQRALAIYQQVYQETPNRPEIAAILMSLGTAWGTLGDAHQAISFLERALAMYEQVYQETPNHLDIANTLNNLGNAWQALGKARQSVSYYERALAIYEQVYQETPNHPDIAGTLSNLGNAWLALGDARQAVSFLERALAILTQVHDPNHPDVAKTLKILELARRAFGDTQVEPPVNRFIQACIEGDNESAESIPVRHLVKNSYDNEGNPLICWMAQHAMFKTLEKVLLLEAWNPNLPNAKQTYPLHYGAMKSAEVTSLLLRAGAHPFVQTAKGSTPAMVAHCKSNMDALKVLLPAIPDLSFQDPTAFDTSYNSFKKDFMEASLHRDAPSCEHLVQVFTLACHFKDWELAQKVIARHNLRSILSQVVGQYPDAQPLLDRVDAFTKACREGQDTLAVEIAENFTFEKDLYDNKGNPLICWMAQHVMTVTLEKVLALDWNPNLPNAKQIYPLHYGALKSVPSAKLLLEARAHPFVRTAQGNTPAMLVRSNNMEALKVLLPTQEGLSFEALDTFEASYATYKENFTLSAAGNEEPLVALELALQLGDAALLQAIGTSKAEGLLSQLNQKYPLGEAAIQACFNALGSKKLSTHEGTA